MGKIIIKKGDITLEEVDVIVNAANTRLAGGGGVDGAIHASAGSSVMEECRKIGGCKTGEVVITNAGDLKVRKIIHTPGPVWSLYWKYRYINWRKRIFKKLLQKQPGDSREKRF